MGKMDLNEAITGYQELTGNLKDLRESLRQLEAKTKETLSLLPAAVLPCATEEETKEFARYFYWNCPKITTQAIKDALSWPAKPHKSLHEYIGPLKVETPCCECNGRAWVEFSSRSDLQAHKKWRLSHTQCGFCRAVERAKLEQIAKETEIEQAQVEQTRKQEALSRWEAETGCMTFEKASAMPYAEYLQTQHWQNRRKRALRRAEYTCQLCNDGDGILHVHHKTYENLGCEEDNDLIVLCENCHQTFHDKLAA